MMCSVESANRNTWLHFIACDMASLGHTSSFHPKVSDRMIERLVQELVPIPYTFAEKSYPRD